MSQQENIPSQIVRPTAVPATTPQAVPFPAAAGPLRLVREAGVPDTAVATILQILAQAPGGISEVADQPDLVLSPNAPPPGSIAASPIEAHPAPRKLAPTRAGEDRSHLCEKRESAMRRSWRVGRHV